MAIITDEQMRDITDILGQAYTRYKDAVGDSDTPGSLYFESNKLSRYIAENLPSEGIVSGCVPSIPVDTTYARFAVGVVRGNDTSISFVQTDATIDRIFQYSFAANCQYGVVFTFSRADLAEASLAFRTTIDGALSAGVSTTVALADDDILEEFTPPFKIMVGTEDIEVWSVSSGIATISPHYNSGTGTVISNHLDDAVAFVSKPLVPTVVFGLPVAPAYQSGGDPATFSYYPPVSEVDYIIIGRGLVDNPNTAAVTRIPVLSAVEDLIDYVDTPVSGSFSTTEKSYISRAIQSLQQTASSAFTNGAPPKVMKSLVIWSGKETGQTFETYWNDRPFVARSNFLRGESLHGLTRFEFSDQFKELYYDQYADDLLTTLALFRGDIFGGSQAYGSTPENLTGTYALDAAADLTYGVWIYRVTATTASGESSPTSAVSVSIPVSAGTTNKITLTWDKINTAIYYHIYRMAAFADRFIEYRLTTPYEVINGIGATVSYDDVGAAGTTVVRRGVSLTGKQCYSATQLQLYIPPVDSDLNPFLSGEDLSDSYTDETAIQNDLEVSVYGITSAGTVGGEHQISIPQGTARSTKFAIGTSSDLYVGIYDIVVTPGTHLNLQNGVILWSPYDFFVVQNK